MAEIDDDDSRGFAAVERAHLRERYLPGFEWTVYETASALVQPRAPLREARIGLVDTCGAHRVDQPPVGTTGRAALVPVDAPFTLTHTGYDVARALRDPEVVHPVGTLRTLQAQGVIGSVAPTTVSVMGGVLIASRLLEHGVPSAVESMLQQQVDLALLVPA
jgi:D-proline reductase (dithiol) PrdB